MVGGGGRESENSVCPCPLLSVFSVFSLFSVYVSQVMPGYIRSRQSTLEGWDVELDNCKTKHFSKCFLKFQKTNLKKKSTHVTVDNIKMLQ